MKEQKDFYLLKNFKSLYTGELIYRDLNSKKMRKIMSSKFVYYITIQEIEIK